MRFNYRKRLLRCMVGVAAALLTFMIPACQAARSTPTVFLPTSSPTKTLVPRSSVPVTPLVPTPLVQPLNQPPTVVPQLELSLNGQYTYVNYDGTLLWQNAQTGAVRILVKNDSGGYAQNPAFSPDGTEIAYSYSTYSKDGLLHSQIRVVRTDGTDDHIVIAPQDANIFVDLPTWSPDGKKIYFTRLIPIEPSNQRSEIDSVPANGGKVVTVIPNGFDVHISLDGKHFVFQKVDFMTYASSLWVANSNGSSAKQLIAENTFAALFGARFAPDGQTLVFAESGPAMKKLPGVQGYLENNNSLAQAHSCLFSFLFVCGLERADAHGLPWDLWLVNVDGTKFERLTNLGVDSPTPVWSSDGKSIVFFEANGIYLLNRQTKKVKPVSSDGGYGGFDWSD